MASAGAWGRLRP
uniref:Uncharacterized protein n=1 Tax=Arundo donax TaxID=35708 RepID=A0A0A9HL43_ARUDO